MSIPPIIWDKSLGPRSAHAHLSCRHIIRHNWRLASVAWTSAVQSDRRELVGTSGHHHKMVALAEPLSRLAPEMNLVATRFNRWYESMHLAGTDLNGWCPEDEFIVTLSTALEMATVHFLNAHGSVVGLAGGGMKGHCDANDSASHSLDDYSASFSLAMSAPAPRLTRTASVPSCSSSLPIPMVGCNPLLLDASTSPTRRVSPHPTAPSRALLPRASANRGTAQPLSPILAPAQPIYMSPSWPTACPTKGGDCDDKEIADAGSRRISKSSLSEGSAEAEELLITSTWSPLTVDWSPLTTRLPRPVRSPSLTQLRPLL